MLREDNRGAVHNALPPILERLAFTEEASKILTTKFEQQFQQWFGSENIVKQTYSDNHYQRIPSTENCNNKILSWTPTSVAVTLVGTWQE